jgi:hypothetical protein
MSILACCSALCLFEKHMLAFVDLIHALPTRGRDIVPNLCFHGEFCICSGGLAFTCFVALCRLILVYLSPDFSCALLSMVSSPFFLTLRSRQF